MEKLRKILGELRMRISEANAIDPDRLNALDASRKADREELARVLITIGQKHGATYERHEEPRNPGYHGASIHLRFELNGVGCTLNIDNLFGGAETLVHWFNTERGPARKFTFRFNQNVGARNTCILHHKATSNPRGWYALAMFLDAGLCLAARGEAFEPITA
jgi:hypothetical protein